MKTAASESQGVTSWLLGTTGVLLSRSQHEWFAFVLLPKPPNFPRVFVVPRDHVSAATWIVHQNWRTDPGAAPGKRNTELNLARVRTAIWQGYEDRWDLLGTPTDDVPVLLPSRLRALAGDPRVSLPPGHPWSDGLPAW